MLRGTQSRADRHTLRPHTCVEEREALMSDVEPTLTIRTETDEAGFRLALAGELDLASAGQLDTAVAELCADGAKRIVLELGELEFMDSTGLRAVLVGAELCEVSGCELLIGRASRQVERLFQVSGVGERLPRRAETT
jgi:anti-anti-sigma factor